MELHLLLPEGATQLLVLLRDLLCSVLFLLGQSGHFRNEVLVIFHLDALKLTLAKSFLGHLGSKGAAHVNFLPLDTSLNLRWVGQEIFKAGYRGHPLKLTRPVVTVPLNHD